MIERRKQPRNNIHCRVFFECSDVHSKEVSQDIGLGLDINEKGMLLESSRPIHATTIKVMVPVKDKDAVEIMGDVIYSIPMSDKGYRTGIIFHKPGDGIAKLFSDK